MQPTQVQNLFMMPPTKFNNKLPTKSNKHTASAFIERDGRPEIDKIFYRKNKELSTSFDVNAKGLMNALGTRT